MYPTNETKKAETILNGKNLYPNGMTEVTVARREQLRWLGPLGI
jgi:hypothetical protein